MRVDCVQDGGAVLLFASIAIACHPHLKHFVPPIVVLVIGVQRGLGHREQRETARTRLCDSVRAQGLLRSRFDQGARSVPPTTLRSIWWRTYTEAWDCFVPEKCTRPRSGSKRGTCYLVKVENEEGSMITRGILAPPSFCLLCSLG